MPAPHGLEAYTFEAEGDELVVFTWGTRDEEGPPNATRTQPFPPSLTAAEQEVLALLVGGASNRVIAERRHVAERTIANQVASILRKVGARSRFELIRRFAGA